MKLRELNHIWNIFDRNKTKLILTTPNLRIHPTVQLTTFKASTHDCWLRCADPCVLIHSGMMWEFGTDSHFLPHSYTNTQAGAVASRHVATAAEGAGWAFPLARRGTCLIFR